MQEGLVELRGQRLYVAGRECFEGQRGWLVIKDKPCRGHLMYDRLADGMPWHWCWEGHNRHAYMVTQLRVDGPHRSQLRLTDESAYAGERRYPQEVSGR